MKKAKIINILKNPMFIGFQDLTKRILCLIIDINEFAVEIQLRFFLQKITTGNLLLYNN
jgi:hypothetical protein